MSKNNDFDNDRRPDLNEYLSKEITQYYGEDVISDIESSSAPNLPKRRRNSRLMSALGIVCAVMFLTGAVIFSGVFVTSGISGFGSGDDSDSDSDIVSVVSDKDKNKTESIVHGDVSEISTDTEIDTSTENITSEFFTDTDSTSSSDTSTENVMSDFFTDTDTYSSNYAEENILTDIDTDITSTDRRTDYFSFPEYPDEEYISEIATDVNNNSETNPNDNVTTGKKFRSWIGTLLMILSLLTALALTQTGEEDNL